MKSWMVWQDTSGLELGVYEAETANDAIRAMLDDAGASGEDVPDEGLRAREMMVAAVGSDGTRLVVWGIGETEDAARNDAEAWVARPRGLRALDFHPVTMAQVARIQAGDVAWPVKP